MSNNHLVSKSLFILIIYVLYILLIDRIIYYIVLWTRWKLVNHKPRQIVTNELGYDYLTPIDRLSIHTESGFKVSYTRNNYFYLINLWNIWQRPIRHQHNPNHYVMLVISNKKRRVPMADCNYVHSISIRDMKSVWIYMINTIQ